MIPKLSLPLLFGSYDQKWMKSIQEELKMKSPSLLSNSKVHCWIRWIFWEAVNPSCARFKSLSASRENYLKSNVDEAFHANIKMGGLEFVILWSAGGRSFGIKCREIINIFDAIQSKVIYRFLADPNLAYLCWKLWLQSWSHDHFHQSLSNAKLNSYMVRGPFRWP